MWVDIVSKELLPPNSSALEQHLADATASISNVPMPPALWDADTCPESLLPWLAWSLSVEEWSSEWPVEIQRSAIKQARDIHLKKGTIGSIKKALQSLGYGDATLIEGLSAVRYDGLVNYDGTYFHGAAEHWASYRVYMARPINIDQANHVRRILDAIAPARSKLQGLHYDGVENIYNGDSNYAGTSTYGAL